MCDPESLGFATTDELSVPETVVIGQDEAKRALDFGFSLHERGYNVFVLGLPGSGRFSFARRMAEERARSRPAPADWCYVYAFDDPRRPRAVELPPGRGPEFRDAMAEVVADLRGAVPQALESDHVSDRRAEIVERHGARAGELMEAAQRELREDEWVALVGTPDAMTVVPARGGEPLTQAAYEALTDETRDEVDEHVRRAARAVLEAQRKGRQVEREARIEVAGYHQEVAGEIVDQRLDSVRDQFQGVLSVLAYLDEAERDIVRNAEAFLRSGPVGLFPTSETEAAEEGTSEFLKRYSVNPLITRKDGDGAPVIEESNPHLRSLFGRTEGQMRLGVMVTDFTQITAGAAHRANGGFLLLRAEEVLSRPLVWPALKRMLRTGELRPVDAAAEMGLLAMQSLEPDPIPADLTVVLIGEPRTFYLLQQLDSEFDEVFKVKVDFATDMEREQNGGGEEGYAHLIAAECRRRSLPAFDASAVARIIEEGSRLAEDQTKLTTRLRPVLDLVLESAHHAGDDEPVTAEHVQAALDDQDLRRRRPERRLLELLERGVLAFDPKGEAVGQLYGIGLSWLGESAFGRPIRVMASAYLGRGGLIHIEREAKLAGRIHNKGFLVVSGYLGRYFARRRPLTLSATLSFDQMYEEVEGDSASAAELYALLSAIGEVPLRQGIAVTGAVNQEGMILPVGGVTAKVEGFFKACTRMGLDGRQGVVFPRRNLDHLCLREDVRRAVTEGHFHLWAIERVEEGWPILSGTDAGESTAEGDFPAGTVHGAVQARLDGWAEQWAETRDEGVDEARP
jgi:predicted ATP-dependent protease